MSASTRPTFDWRLVRSFLAALLLVGGWFLAHRCGRLRGFVDANKNGVDDRTERGGIA